MCWTRVQAILKDQNSASSVRVLGGTVPTPSYRPTIMYNSHFEMRARQ